MRKKDINNFTPAKTLLFLVIVMLIVSFAKAEKLYFWEEWGHENIFQEYSLMYLGFLKGEEKKEIEVIVIEEEVEIKQATEEDKRDFFNTQIKPPYRVLIIGDSFITGGVGIELERELIKYENFDVHRFGKPSTGLSRPDYFDWNEKLEELLEEYNPNITIVMFGANDGQAMYIDGGYIKYSLIGEWDETYRQRAYNFMDRLKRERNFVIWLGNPIARSEQYSGKMERINSIVESQSIKFLNVSYISTWDILANDNGNYSEYTLDENSRKWAIRTSDGIHVTGLGGQMIIDEIVSELNKVMEME